MGKKTVLAVVAVSVGLIAAAVVAQTVRIAPSKALQLKQAQADIQAGDGAKAAKDIQGSLNEYNSQDLQRGLFLLGQAKKAQADKTADKAAKDKLYVEAGLEFMRSAVFFPYTNDAPEAMFSAGECSRLAGDADGAKAAYETCVVRYGDSAAGKRAKAALGS